MGVGKSKEEEEEEEVEGDLHEIDDDLWLGSVSAASNKKLLKQKKITHVLSVMSSSFFPEFPKGVVHKKVLLFVVCFVICYLFDLEWGWCGGFFFFLFCFVFLFFTFIYFQSLS